MDPLKEARIILGISGGIAAYKVADLTSKLRKRSAFVRVVMTKAATNFITPLTMEALSGAPVALDLFDRKEDPFEHLNLARWAQILVIAPATANLLAKLRVGMADDFLSTLYLAWNGPTLICPAMNNTMFQNKSVQENVKVLKERGVHFLGPMSGSLACGEQGKGRLAEPDEILEEIENILSKKDLQGMKLLITAGPTHEYMDPVRFLSNPSSGKMGYALARVAIRRGAEVTLISGPTSIPFPRGVRFVRVSSAVEMYNSVMENFRDASIIIKSAAVSDYRFKERYTNKIKKDREELSLELVRNPDILKEVGKKKENQILVGFAAESEDVISYAKKKLKEKNLDLIVANDITSPGAGFRHETNRVVIIGDGIEEKLPIMSKEEVAERLYDIILKIKEKKSL